MQSQLNIYDSVLFEGVKPAGLDPIDPELDDNAKAEATTDRLNLLVEIADRYHETTSNLPTSFNDLLKSDDPRIVAIVRSIRTDGWGEKIGLKFVGVTMGSKDKADTNANTKAGSTRQHIEFTSNGADRKPGGDGPDTDIVVRSEPYTPNDPRKPAPEGIQTQLANALHVSFQLDEMDTTNPEWVNADIDIKELQEQLAGLGEDNAMILNLIEGNSFSAKLMGFVLKFVARSPTMSSMMKLVMMDMLAMLETTDMMNGQLDAVNEVILHGRNRTVIEYLKAELKAHPDHKDIAIFYGAGHMPELEEIITSTLGYEFESNIWTDAMSVNTKDTGFTDAQVKMMRKMIKNSLEKQF